MKNTKYTKSTLLLLSFLFLIFTACSHDAINQNNKEDSAATGTTTVKMYVPDYYAMANSSERAIAPQTEYAKLSYLDDETTEWVAVSKIALADAERSKINSENVTFPGYIYTFIFDKVYAQQYAAGTLRIDLLDSTGAVITSGQNLQPVDVTSGEKSSVTFYTVPQDSYQSESFLNKGQMKFYSYSFKAGKKYFIHDVVSDGNNYPDIVFFNKNGTLDKYFVVDSKEESVIEIAPFTEDVTKIIGIWADDDTYVSKYTISIYPELLGLDFSESSIDICKDETYQVTVKTVPEGAYLGNVTYSSSNDLVTVSQNGVVSTASTDNELISATITATYGGFTATTVVNFAKGTNLLGTLSGDDLHWTKEGSPYRIKGNLLVAEKTTLVIDAGVTVRFTGSYGITVRGEINAKGTAVEPVIFTGKNGTSNVQWSGISIGGSTLTTEKTYTYVSGNIVEYCNFDSANEPLVINSGTYVNHCKFTNGGSVKTNYASVLINNEFNNGLNIDLGSSSSTTGDVIVENNIFRNYFRVYRWCYGAESVIKHNDFYNCQFKLDTYIYSQAREAISYNNFYESSINIRYNSDRSNKPLRFNNFINCSDYIVYVNSEYCSNSSYNFSNNYWGEEGTTELNRIGNFENASFIYDYFDYPERSRVDYSDWLTEPVEKCGYLGEAFIGFDVALSAQTGTIPDSFSPVIVVNTDVTYAQNAITQIRYASSKELLKNAEWKAFTSSYEYLINLSDVVTANLPVYVQIKDNKGNESHILSKEIYCKGDKYLDFTFKVNNSDADYSNFKESSNPVVTISVVPGYHKHDIKKYRITQSYSTSSDNNQNIFDNTEWINYSDSFEYTIDQTKLLDGYAYITIQLKDEKESISTSSMHVIPFGAPVITCTKEDNKIYTDSDESVTYYFTATDGGKIKKYNLYIDSALVQSGSDNWGTSFTLEREIGLKYMAAGSHTIVLKVIDEAKNTGVKQMSFTINHANTVDTSSLAGVAWDTTTGQPLKDERTTYLWHLDAGGTEADDSSAGIGDYTNAIGGFGGGCASYVYTSNSIPLDVSTNQFTVEYWIKGSSSQPYLYMNKDNSFMLHDDYEYFYYLDEDDNVRYKNHYNTKRPESDAEWHYVAKVFNGSYYAVYIDGVLTNYSENINVELNNNDSKLSMSSSCDAIDEIRISNAARSADEINAYYKAAKEILDNSYGTLSGVIY